MEKTILINEQNQICTFSRDIYNLFLDYLQREFFIYQCNEESGVIYFSKAMFNSFIKILNYRIQVFDEGFGIEATVPIGVVANEQELTNQVAQFVCELNNRSKMSNNGHFGFSIGSGCLYYRVYIDRTNDEMCPSTRLIENSINRPEKEIAYYSRALIELIINGKPIPEILEKYSGGDLYEQ